MAKCFYCDKDHYPNYLCPEKLNKGIDTREKNKRSTELASITLEISRRLDSLIASLYGENLWNQELNEGEFIEGLCGAAQNIAEQIIFETLEKHYGN